MLYRKIEKPIREFLAGHRDKVLVVEGARQTGKVVHAPIYDVMFV